jgi:hypothetical protein
VAEERVVVEVDLGVEREELVVFGGDEGIDLDQRGVRVNEGAIEALKKGDGVIDLGGLEAEGKGELACLPCAEADGGVDGLLEDGFRSLGGDLFNLHAAGLRGHEDKAAGGAIEHDAEIELAVNGCGLLDEQALDLLARGSGLMGDELHAENVLGVELGIFAGASDFDTAALAAAAGVNLRLDDHAGGAFREEGARHGGGFFEGVGHFPAGNGHAVFRQDFFCLILVDFHVVGNRPTGC